VSTEGGGTHAFLSSQPDGSPVAYDPCRPVLYVVNDRTQPFQGDELLAEAIRGISEITGLQFGFEGPTGEVPLESREPFQKDRYGDRWAPVLISWADPAELSELAGDVAGFGGSARVNDPGQTGRQTSKQVYVSGVVALDGPQLSQMLEREDGWAQARSVIQHELGHLVGLDHVADESQLMHGSGNSDVTGPQGGDIAGLSRLGRGTCFELL